MGAPELVGRDAESAALRAALDDSRPVVLLGESGIGKTSLIESVVASDGRPVLRGGGLTTLSWMPYLAVARALGRTSFDVDEAAAVADVVEREVGADVLFVDDLHACDAGSLEVLALLASRVTLVAAIRLGHAGTDDALAVVRAHGFEELPLDPLDAEDSRRLVLTTTPSLAPEQVRRVVDVSGGVPLLLEELAAGSSEADLVRALRTRLAPLDAEAHEAALLLAVAGRPVVDDRPAYDALVLLRVAERPSPGLVQVRHALLAAALLDGVPAEDVRQVHRTIAERTDDLLLRAFHELEAGESAEARALAVRAADEAATPGRRAEALVLAVRASRGADGPDDARLRLRAATELVAASRGADALEVLEPVDDRVADVVLAGRICAVKAHAAWMVGDLAAFEEALARAGDLEDAVPPDVLVELLYQRATYAILVRPQKEGAVEACDRLTVAAEAADKWRGRALMRRAVLGSMAGDDSAFADMTEALALTQQEGDLAGELATANNLVDVLMTSGRLQDAFDLATDHAARSAALGLQEWASQFRAMAATVAGYLGLNGECLRLCDEGLATATDPRTRLQARGVRLLRLLELGDTDVVLESLPGLRVDAAASPETLATASYLEATALWHQGRLAEALQAAADPVLHGRSEFPASVRAAQDWSAHEQGRMPGTTTGPSSDSSADLAAAAESRAVGMLAVGRVDLAPALFDEAARLWEPRWRFAELRCRWAAADSRRQLGDASAVAELLALEEVVAELSFSWLLARVQRSLRLAGVARAARREADRRSLLSPREGEILTLAAEGLRDPEIARRLSLGVPTVRRHIGNAVVKLGVPTRAAAVAALVRA